LLGFVFKPLASFFDYTSRVLAHPLPPKFARSRRLHPPHATLQLGVTVWERGGVVDLVQLARCGSVEGCAIVEWFAVGNVHVLLTDSSVMAVSNSDNSVLFKTALTDIVAVSPRPGGVALVCVGDASLGLAFRRFVISCDDDVLARTLSEVVDKVRRFGVAERTSADDV
jgi:hypothetical protein